MAIKLADTLKPMGQFPAAEAEDLEITLSGGAKKSIQEAYEDGDLGGGGSGVPAVETMPASPSDNDIVLYVGEDTSNYKKGHTYQAHTYFAFGQRWATLVFFNTSDPTQDSQVLFAVGEYPYLDGWWFHSFSDDSTILCKVKGSDNPEDQHTLAGLRESSSDYATWTDITPLEKVMVNSMPTAPSSDSKTLIYVGYDTESYKKGHTYQYSDSGLYAFVVDENTLLYFSTPELMEGLQVKKSAGNRDFTGWYIDELGTAPAIVLRNVENPSNPDVQYATFNSCMRNSSKDEVWVDITPIPNQIPADYVDLLAD